MKKQSHKSAVPSKHVTPQVWFDAITRTARDMKRYTRAQLDLLQVELDADVAELAHKLEDKVMEYTGCRRWQATAAIAEVALVAVMEPSRLSKGEFKPLVIK